MRTTYMIHEDNSYTGGLTATLTEFEGTEREMLEYLSGDDDGEPDPGEKRFPSEFTDAELRGMLEEANGDGANVTTVFEKQADGKWKQVLG